MPPEEIGCIELEERLEALVESDGEGAYSAAERRHLAECTDCTRSLEMARRVRDELKALPKHDLPEASLARIRALGPPPAGNAEGGVRERAASGRGARGRRTGGRLWLAAAAAVVVVATGVVWVVGDRAARPGPAEIARAELEMRYALAQVARLSRKAGEELRDDVLAGRVAGPVRRGLSRSMGSMRVIGDAELEQPGRQGESES